MIEYLVVILIVSSLLIQIITTNINTTIENTGILIFSLLRITPSIQLVYLFITSLKKEKYTIESVYRLLNLKKKFKSKNAPLKYLTLKKVLLIYKP